jgi:hypothetical protein
MFIGSIVAIVIVLVVIALSFRILRVFFRARNVDVEHLERGPMISQKIPEPAKPLVEEHNGTK